MLGIAGSSMSKGSGAGTVDFFHGFQVALMMTVMFNLTQFIYWRCCASRRGTCWQVHGPTFYTLIATLMVNIQPMMILIIGSYKYCCAPCEFFGINETACPSTGKSFPPVGAGPRECDGSGNVFWDESYCQGTKLSTFPSKTSGWLIQIFATWGGFVFMFIGVMQATQLHKKLGKRWRAIRGARVQ